VCLYAPCDMPMHQQRSWCHHRFYCRWDSSAVGKDFVTSACAALFKMHVAMSLVHDAVFPVIIHPSIYTYIQSGVFDCYSNHDADCQHKHQVSQLCLAEQPGSVQSITLCSLLVYQSVSQLAWLNLMQQPFLTEQPNQRLHEKC
jgi:hypothetical protein